MRANDQDKTERAATCEGERQQSVSDERAAQLFAEGREVQKHVAQQFRPVVQVGEADLKVRLR